MKVKTKISCIIPGVGMFEKDNKYELDEKYFDEIFFEKLEDAKIELEQGEKEDANRSRKTRN